MTITMDVPQATGFELDRVAGHQKIKPAAVPQESESKPEIAGEALEKAQRFGRNLGNVASQRITLLGILLASLQSVPFDDVSTLLGVKPTYLVRFMHGVEQIPARTADRWEPIAEIVQNLSRVLKPEAFDRWFNTAIPDLGKKTPLQMISARKSEAVVSLTRSYLDDSFH